MTRFVARRIAGMVLILFVISVATFVIFNVIPGGDPVLRIAGRTANEATRNQVRKDFGFDKPLYVQYTRLMEKAVTGDLVSYSNQTNVWEEVRRGIPATASLVIGAGILWFGLGVLFGLISARKPGGFSDRFLTAFALIGISLPVFWIGAMLLYYLTYKVQIFPAGGYVGLTDDPWEWLKSLILPWFTLSILFIGIYSRLLRSSLLDVQNEDYVRTARAKGLSERRVQNRHVLRNGLIPIVTLFGLDFGSVIGGGAILTESVYGLQGVGQYAADSIGSLDLPPVMGTTLYAAFFIVSFSTLVDIAYAWLDPRIRYDRT